MLRRTTNLATCHECNGLYKGTLDEARHSLYRITVYNMHSATKKDKQLQSVCLVIWQPTVSHHYLTNQEVYTTEKSIRKAGHRYRGFEIIRILHKKYSKAIGYTVQYEVVKERGNDNYPSPTSIWRFGYEILPIT